MESVSKFDDENLFQCARLAFVTAPTHYLAAPHLIRNSFELDFFDVDDREIDDVGDASGFDCDKFVDIPRLFPGDLLGSRAGESLVVRARSTAPTPAPSPRPTTSVYPPRHVFTDAEFLKLQQARFGQEMNLADIYELFPHIEPEKVYREMCLTSPPRKNDLFNEETGNLKPRAEALAIIRHYRRLDVGWDPVTNRTSLEEQERHESKRSASDDDESYVEDEPKSMTPRVVKRRTCRRTIDEQTDAAYTMLRLAQRSTPSHTSPSPSSSSSSNESSLDEYTSTDPSWRVREVVGAGVDAANIVTSSRTRRPKQNVFSYDDRLKKAEAPRAVKMEAKSELRAAKRRRRPRKPASETKTEAKNSPASSWAKVTSAVPKKRMKKRVVQSTNSRASRTRKTQNSPKKNVVEVTNTCARDSVGDVSDQIAIIDEIKRLMEETGATRSACQRLIGSSFYFVKLCLEKPDKRALNAKRALLLRKLRERAKKNGESCITVPSNAAAATPSAGGAPTSSAGVANESVPHHVEASAQTRASNPFIPMVHNEEEEEGDSHIVSRASAFVGYLFGR